VFYPNLEKHLPTRCTALHSSHLLRLSCTLTPGDMSFVEEDLFLYVRYARPTVKEPALTDIMVVIDSEFPPPKGTIILLLAMSTTLYPAPGSVLYVFSWFLPCLLCLP
jgi:hypothetical protein